MKNKFLITALSWLIGFSAFAQFPVKVNPTFIFGSPGHVAAEGRINEGLYNNAGNFIYPSSYVFDGTNTISANGATAPAVGTTLGIAPYVDPGTAKIFKGWNIWCSDNILLRLKLDNAINLSSSKFPFANQIMTQANQTIWVPTGDMIVREMWRMSVEYRGSLTALSNGGKFVLIANPVFETISSDFNFAAKTVFMPFGDSITYGTLAPINNNAFFAKDIYTGVIRDNLNRINKSVRLVGQGVGGWSTVELDIAMRRNEFNLNGVGLIGLNIGMNDSPNYTPGSPTLARERLFRIIANIRVVAPTVPFILFRPTRRQNVAEEAKLEAFRTEVIDYVFNTLADPNMKLINLNSNVIWPDTNNSRYNTNDGVTTAGNYIHPSGSQHLLMGNFTSSEIQADPVFLAKIN